MSFFKNILEKGQNTPILESNFTMKILIFLICSYILLYMIPFFLLRRMMRSKEDPLIDLFIEKVGKIPALIEVMRPYVAKKESFARIIMFHTQAMIQQSKSIYDILGLNTKIQHEFLFLMKLSMQIPTLQKDEYFVYIRDFAIEYERMMRFRFAKLNTMIRYWNLFVQIKNATGIGLILPGQKRVEIL